MWVLRQKLRTPSHMCSARRAAQRPSSAFTHTSSSSAGGWQDRRVALRCWNGHCRAPSQQPSSTEITPVTSHLRSARWVGEMESRHTHVPRRTNRQGGVFTKTTPMEVPPEAVLCKGKSFLHLFGHSKRRQCPDTLSDSPDLP